MAPVRAGDQATMEQRTGQDLKQAERGKGRRLVFAGKVELVREHLCYVSISGSLAMVPQPTGSMSGWAEPGKWLQQSRGQSFVHAFYVLT